MMEMYKITDKGFADFLTTKPLYTKIKVVGNLTAYTSAAFIDHYDFKDKAFKFVCPTEKEIQTFKTDLSENGFSHIFGRIAGDSPRQDLPNTFDKETGLLDFKIHLKGVCQSCNAKIDFLLRATSDRDWSRRNEGINIFVQKIGQFPAYEISLNSTLKKYLSNEDQENYKKALVCLSISYGIGSYSYLRRVIENEIKRIIKDISELDFDGVEHVRNAYEQFQSDFQMSKLIDVINKHLPLSLKEMGDNPIRLLYEQLSGGIHEFTDEECIEKSSSIDVLLNYVIKKINEEKYQLNDVKAAMQKLRKSSN